METTSVPSPTDTLALSRALAQGLLDYLATRPYNEVYILISAIVKLPIILPAEPPKE